MFVVRDAMCQSLHKTRRLKCVCVCVCVCMCVYIYIYIYVIEQINNVLLNTIKLKIILLISKISTR